MPFAIDCLDLDQFIDIFLKKLGTEANG